MLNGWEAESAAGFIQFRAAGLKPAVRRWSQSAPEPSAECASRRQRADRVGRGPRRCARVDVGDECCDPHSRSLSGECRREREDVVDDDIRLALLYQRLRLLGRLEDSLVGLQRRLAGRKDGVLRRWRKGQAFAEHDLFPLPRGLKRHIVPARAKRAAERDHREGVARVAEGTEQ